MKFTIPEEEYVEKGHMGCLGCGGALAMRYLLKGLGNKTILAVPACCWAVIPGVYPYSCLDVPMQYVAFEATGSSITGIEAALRAKGKKEGTTVVGWAGDGGTADIGIQALSGAVERGNDVKYICYDNEAYMNTGIQRSSATPIGAWTTTTPVGKTKAWKKTPKKNLVEIMVAHEIPYACTASVAYPEDMIKKAKKMKDIEGPCYMHVFAPCPTGWKYPPEKLIEIARLATETCTFPIYEVTYGKYKINKKIRNKKKKDVIEYLKIQGRFRKLDEPTVKLIQKNIDKEWKLLKKKEEFFGEEK
ncbi:MAG: 3-methyl-2-oxobutanoate dehydrogenase subunit beta [Candidatus Methanofastidiosia archaeon]